MENMHYNEVGGMKLRNWEHKVSFLFTESVNKYVQPVPFQYERKETIAWDTAGHVSQRDRKVLSSLSLEAKSQFWSQDVKTLWEETKCDSPS